MAGSGDGDGGVVPPAGAQDGTGGIPVAGSAGAFISEPPSKLVAEFRQFGENMGLALLRQAQRVRERGVVHPEVLKHEANLGKAKRHFELAVLAGAVSNEAVAEDEIRKAAMRAFLVSASAP